MDGTFDPIASLLDLDTRYDELFRRLDELDKQVARVLKESQSLPRVKAAAFEGASAKLGEQDDLSADSARAA